MRSETAKNKSRMANIWNIARTGCSKRNPRNAKYMLPIIARLGKGDLAAYTYPCSLG
jgi:hypothetical protein